MQVADDFDLPDASAESRYAELCEKYRSDSRSRRFQAAAGWTIYAVATIAILAIWNLGPGGGSEPFVVIVSFAAYFLGLFVVLDAKGQSWWWSLAGIFAAFLPDLHPESPPSPDPNDQRQDGYRQAKGQRLKQARRGWLVFGFGVFLVSPPLSVPVFYLLPPALRILALLPAWLISLAPIDWMQENIFEVVLYGFLAGIAAWFVGFSWF